MSLLCQFCLKNFITALKPPFGGFICAQEHFHCAECIGEDGKCKVCGGNTQFLQFTIQNSEGQEDVQETYMADLKDGNDDLHGSGSKQMQREIFFDDDLVRACQAISNSEFGTETVYSEDAVESKPIITLLPVMRRSDELDQKSEDRQMSSNFLQESYLRDFDGTHKSRDTESRCSSRQSAVIFQQQTIKKEVKNISNSGMENIVKEQKFSSVKILPNSNSNETATNLQSSGSQKISLNIGTPTDVITTTVSNSEVIYMTQVTQSSTQIDNDNASPSNEKHKVATEKLLPENSLLSQPGQSEILSDNTARPTVPILLLPLEDLRKQENLSQNLAFQTTLLALKDQIFPQELPAKANEQIDWSNILKLANNFSNYLQPSDHQSFTRPSQQVSQAKNNNIVFEASFDPDHSNKLSLVTHLKDFPLNTSQGCTVFTTTFQVGQQSDKPKDMAEQEIKKVVVRSNEKVLKDVGTTISTHFSNKSIETISKHFEITNTTMNDERQMKTLDLVKAAPETQQQLPKLPKKYLVMHAAESMPAALASQGGSRKDKILTDECYRKILQSFQEEGKIKHEESTDTIIKEPGYSNDEKNISDFEEIEGKKEKVLKEYNQAQLEEKSELSKRLEKRPQLAEKHYYAEKCHRVDKTYRVEKKVHTKTSKRKHISGEHIVEQSLGASKAEKIRDYNFQNESMGVEFSRAVPLRVHPINSRHFERLASQQMLSDQKTVTTVADFLSEHSEFIDIDEDDETIPKGVPDAHTVLLNRAPIRCPESECKHSLFISDFCQHLVFDHNNVPLERILPGREKIFFCDVRALRRDTNRCIMCYFVRNAVKNIGTTDFKDYLPVMVMATRIQHQKMFDFSEKKRQDDLTNDFFFFWITGLVPEKRPVRYELTIWPMYTDSSRLYFGYKNHVYSLRNQQEPSAVLNHGSGILLYPSEIKKLSNDFQDVLVLKIVVH